MWVTKWRAEPTELTPGSPSGSGAVILGIISGDCSAESLPLSCGGRVDFDGKEIVRLVAQATAAALLAIDGNGEGASPNIARSGLAFFPTIVGKGLSFSLLSFGWRFIAAWLG